jgi:endonuclease/exonuclease/phosphatase family metal-dependent hydrolase
MFSYTGIQLKAVDEPEPMYSFRRFEARRDDLEFNVIAVWPWQTKASKTAFRQMHEGLIAHGRWIAERPTVILGDFNANASFRGNNWKDLLDLLKPLGLVSAYHRHFGEEFGRETRPTHFHRGKSTAPFHLDYCFLPEEWARHIETVEVGSFADWREHSDHAPLRVDLDL